MKKKKYSKFLKMQAHEPYAYRVRLLKDDGSKEVIGTFNGRGFRNESARFAGAIQRWEKEQIEARKKEGESDGKAS